MIGKKWYECHASATIGVQQGGNMSGFTEYDAYDAVWLAGLVRKGEVSPVELCEEAIERGMYKYTAPRAAFESIRCGGPDGRKKSRADTLYSVGKSHRASGHVGSFLLDR